MEQEYQVKEKELKTFKDSKYPCNLLMYSAASSTN